MQEAEKLRQQKEWEQKQQKKLQEERMEQERGLSVRAQQTAPLSNGPQQGPISAAAASSPSAEVSVSNKERL